MELCEGGELLDVILNSRKSSGMTEEHAANIMKQVLAAVSYCHSKSIVHRDLKPENILLVSQDIDSYIKIVDFGTSVLYNPSKKLTRKQGTIHYLAPEVLKNSYNEKCDIWSCGVIMYILLCGRMPFGGKNENEVIRCIEKAQYSTSGKEWKHISQAAKNLLSRMLTPDVKARVSA
jgi:calcium-dependent protein kinase